MKHFGGAIGYERDIAAVLAAVRAEYNLSADDPKDVANPFGNPDGDPFAGPDGR